jgi:hypothetical protein
MHRASEVVIVNKDFPDKPVLVIRVRGFDREGRPEKVEFFDPFNPACVITLSGRDFRDFAHALGEMAVGRL